MHLFGLNWHLQPVQRQMYQLSEDNTSGLPFPTDLSVSPVGNTGLEIPERRGKDDSELSFHCFLFFFSSTKQLKEKKVGKNFRILELTNDISKLKQVCQCLFYSHLVSHCARVSTV